MTYQPVMAANKQQAYLAEVAVPSFDEHLAFNHVSSLTAGQVDTLQINVGKLCNQVCQHCHVDAGPQQTEANMDEATATAVVDLIARLRPRCVDLTGGAPELNPHFRTLVTAARRHGVEEIIDRCNF